MHMTGEPDGPPLKSAVAIADVLTGLYAANAVQAALIRRNETGEGASSIALCPIYSGRARLSSAGIMLRVRQGRRPHGQWPSQSRALRRLSGGRRRMSSSQPATTASIANCATSSAHRNWPPIRAFVNKDRVTRRAELTALLNDLTRTFKRSDLLAKLVRTCRPGRSTRWSTCSTIRR